jgi:Sigma-70, region 4
MSSLPSPQIAGAVLAALQERGGVGEEAELFDQAAGVGLIDRRSLRETLRWLEAALLVEQVGPESWRLASAASFGPAEQTASRVDPSAIAAALNEIAGWGAATLGASGALQAAAAISAEKSIVPTPVAEAIKRLEEVDGSSSAARYRLDVAFAGLEKRMPEPFSIYHRRRLTEEKPPTLRQLGEELGISQERVRQLEHQFQTYLDATVSNNVDSPIFCASLRLSAQLGPVAKASAVRTAAQALGAGSDSLIAYPHRLVLLLRLGGSYQFDGDWFARDEFRREAAAVMERLAHDERFASVSEVASALTQLGLRAEDVPDWLADLEGYRVFREQLVPLGTSLADRGVAILAICAKPMSLDELFDELKEDRSARSFKAQMQSDSRVRRVGIRQYGLASWGGREYSSIVGEMRLSIERHGGSVSWKELADELSQSFGISPASVHIHAAGAPFDLDARGNVSVADASPETKPLKLTRCCFRLPGGWSFRRAVDDDVLRGSGTAIPLGFAKELGIGPGESTRLRSSFGSVHCGWPAHVANIGSLRQVALDIGAVHGDYLFLIASTAGTIEFEHVGSASCELATGLERLGLECGLPSASLQRIAISLGLEDGTADALATSVRQRLRQREEDRLLEFVPETRDDLLDALAEL